MKYVIVKESVRESWLTDAGTYLLALALMIPGWLIDSNALAVSGFIIFWITLLTKSQRRQQTMTAEQAIAYIKETNE